MRKRIGDFFVERGVITAAERQQILAHSQDSGLRFGEAGIELGILSRDKLIEVFGPNYNVDLFQLEPGLFPAVTKELLTPEFMIRHGVAALGYKVEAKFLRSRRLLNVGLLNPGKQAALEDIQAIAQSKLPAGDFDGIKTYLILADQLLNLLSHVYGLNENQIRDRAPGEIDETFALYLEN